MKICAFENAGSVALVVPNWRKFSLDWRPDRLNIPNLDLWLIGEAAKIPAILGKRFPIHDQCDEPYCFDLFFRQEKPEKVSSRIAIQLERMSRILSDRPRIVLEDYNLPLRTPPWSTRRNAWGLDSTGTKVKDQRWITTKQEVALTCNWLINQYVNFGVTSSPRILRVLETGKVGLFRQGEIDPWVAEWRRSPAAWPESRFETPKNAEFFDIRLFQNG